MGRVLFISLVGYFVAVSYGSPTASFINPCKPGDDECVLASAQAALPHLADGVPSLGVEPLDPLVLDDVKSEEDGLQLQFKNLRVAELRHCNFVKMSLAADISNFDLEMHCPITATGQYKIGGKLLFVPIEGEGDCEVKTKKILITIKAQLKSVDGHWAIDKLDHTYVPEEQIFFRLDNLFNGDEEKAKPVLDVLNLSWEQVILTVGKPIIQEIVNKAKDHINGFLASVPAKELYLA